MPRGPGEERGDRVRQEQGEVRPLQVGAELLQELQGGASGKGDLPPGEPGVPFPSRALQEDRRRSDSLSRFLFRYGLSYHPDRRSRSGRMGSRRDRGGGCDVRTALLHETARRNRIQAHREVESRRYRDRSRSHRRGDAQEEGRGRKVRGILRTRIREPRARGQGHHRQHGPRVRCDHGILPRRRQDRRLPEAHRTQREAHRPHREVRQGAVPLVRRRGRVHRHAGAGPRRCGTFAGRAQEAPGQDPALEAQGQLR